MTSKHIAALKITAVLWVVWGLVHAFFGVATMAVDTSTGFAYIAAGVPAEELAAQYHPAVGNILNQHGWNLLWFGTVTTIGGVLVWKRNMTAIWVSAMVGGLADLGYFVFLDIPGYATFFPGTTMTLISGTATVLGFWVLFAHRKTAAD